MSTLHITSETQKIIVKGGGTVAIVSAGPPGPTGPPGQSGQAISFEYDNATPLSSHVINHNLNYKPNVVAEEYTTGVDLMFSIIYHTNNQIELQFNTPRAIRARLS